MTYSFFDYDGTSTTIQTDISCVSTEHMYAFEVLSEDESNVTLSDVALPATFTKNNAGVLCELSTAPSTKIRIIRSTPYDVLMHDFSNGAQFNAHSVDEVYEQLLYLCQETVEGKLIMDSSGITAAGSGGKLYDSRITTWSGRTQEQKNKDSIDPRDYGATAYKSMSYSQATTTAINSTVAFNQFEQQIKGQAIDLKGQYYIVDSLPRGNNYYNGHFVVGGLNHKQELINSWDIKWIEGCGEGFVYDEIQSRDAHRSAGILQSVAYDSIEQVYYCLSSYADGLGGEQGIIQKYHIESKTTLYASDVSVKSTKIGHQGIGLQYIDGAPKLWVGTHKTDPKSGTHILRCTPPTNGGDITNIEYFKVYDESEGLNTTYHCSPTVSPQQNLICVSNVNYAQKQNLIKIFDINTFTDTGNNYSEQYVSKFYLANKHDGATFPVQSVVTDGKFVYVLLGISLIHVYTLQGKLVRVVPFNVGYNLSQNLIDANGTAVVGKYYEPESLLFVPTNDGYTLAVLTAMGYTGSWDAETDVRRNYIHTSIPRYQFIGRDFGSKDRPQLIVSADKGLSYPYTKGFNVLSQENSQAVGSYSKTHVLKPYRFEVCKIGYDNKGFIVSLSTDAGRTATTISCANGANNGGAIVMYGNDDSTGASGSTIVYAGNKGTQHGVAVESNGTIKPVVNNMLLGSKTLRFNANLTNINASAVSVYADNAAAKAGGLVNGDVYRTSTGQLMIVY